MVFVTGPVAGVTVAAYPLDVTGGQADATAIATSDPTADDGAFHLDLGTYHGPLELVARGAGTYTEPATGVLVSWNGTTELRAAYVARNPSTLALDLAFPRGAAITGFAITPFIDLAVAYAGVRATSGLSSDFADALTDSYALFATHLDLDFWAVAPTVLTAGPTSGWNDGVQEGVELAGMSALVLRMAKDSSISPSGITALQLLGLLREDLVDGRFDGKGIGGSVLALGACATVCDLSGTTLRGNLAEAIATFLGSPSNTSGLGVTDATGLLTAIACRGQFGDFDLFPAITGACTFDTSPPEITLTGLDDGQLVGVAQAQVTAFDALAMGDLTIGLYRGDDDLTVDDPASTTDLYYPDLLTTSITAPDAQTKVAALSIDSTVIAEGGVTLRVSARDLSPTGNPMSIDFPLVVNNLPLATLSGTVTIGGRVVGALVTAYEYDAGTKGPALGSATTDASGYYAITVADTAAQTILVQAANPPGMPAASYVEATNGTVIDLSPTDVAESILTAWTSTDRADGNITAWTTIAAAGARALPAGGSFASNVEEAYGWLDAHFSEPGHPIDIRNDAPADLTSTVGTTSLNAQVRYGLMNMALGELADTHAAASSATPAAMNTLTLLHLLVDDLGGDGTGVPYLDGRDGSGQLADGTVSLTSYVTRVDLAVAAVAFLTTNPRNATTFTETDILPLLDHLSTDAALPPYPASEPPHPYDTIPPVVSFGAPTPADGQVLRGTIAADAQATDNRALATNALVWFAPAGSVTMSTLDTTAGPMGPWILVGTLNTDAYPEGNLVLTARATDQAAHATDASRTFVVDRTPPLVSIGAASDPGGAIVPPGGWTGAATLTITGTVLDQHLSAATCSWNGGPAMALTLGAGGAWTITLAAAGGANTLSINALDAAGNASAANATYNRDATPPSVTIIAYSGFVDEATMTATVSGSGAGTVTYGAVPGTVTLDGTPVSFTKYASKYGATDGNLPRWHFNVGDDHSTTSAIAFQTQLRKSDGTILVPWTGLAAVTGAGYNREQVISSATWADIPVTHGTYLLDYRATDEAGNTTPVGTISFTQSIKPPPVRQRAGSACDPIADAQCPAHYGLDTTHNNASVLILGGATLPTNKIHIAQGFIDNPNTVAVRVNLSASASATWARGFVYRSPGITGSPVPWIWDVACSIAQTATTTPICYVPKSTAETDSNGAFPTGMAVSYQVSLVGGGALAACTGCFPHEVEIPPGASAEVWITTDPWSFLQGPLASLGEIAAVGSTCALCGTPITNVTGALENYWVDCYGDGCGIGTDMLKREVHFLVRASYTPSVAVSLTSRPAVTSEPLQLAPGTNTVLFGYASSLWNTTETGF